MTSSMAMDCANEPPKGGLEKEVEVTVKDALKQRIAEEGFDIEVFREFENVVGRIPKFKEVIGPLNAILAIDNGETLVDYVPIVSENIGKDEKFYAKKAYMLRNCFGLENNNYSLTELVEGSLKQYDSVKKSERQINTSAKKYGVKIEVLHPRDWKKIAPEMNYKRAERVVDETENPYIKSLHARNSKGQSLRIVGISWEGLGNLENLAEAAQYITETMTDLPINVYGYKAEEKQVQDTGRQHGKNHKAYDANGKRIKHPMCTEIRIKRDKWYGSGNPEQVKGAISDASKRVDDNYFAKVESDSVSDYVTPGGKHLQRVERGFNIYLTNGDCNIEMYILDTNQNIMDRVSRIEERMKMYAKKQLS